MGRRGRVAGATPVGGELSVLVETGFRFCVDFHLLRLHFHIPSAEFGGR